jgi:hypothetical protein
MICTIYKNIYETTAGENQFRPISYALNRIKNCKSQEKVNEIRATIDKEKANAQKKNLPSICFSGKFPNRNDGKNLQHSGFIVIDFDHVEVAEKMAELQKDEYFYALWVSPSGNGIKGLIRVADGSKHREHFTAFRERYPEIDASGINESRVCFESADPHLYTNEKSKVWAKVTKIEKIESRVTLSDEKDIFDKLLKWQANKHGAFVNGERNTFIFKLAGGCCRFGLHKDSCLFFLLTNYPPSNSFTKKEMSQAVESAYKRNPFGTAEFVRDTLIDKVSRNEIEVTEKDIEEYKDGEPAKDVIYGASVKAQAFDIYFNGYEKVNGIGVEDIDYLFKFKTGEVTLLTGIGNYGKSTFYKWFIVMRMYLFDEKFAVFGPEDNPANEFYHDFAEIILGCDATPSNPKKPKITDYDRAIDYVNEHVFYLYPQDVSPTPDYIKARFLEMIFKEKVSGCIIDPFNRMTHRYVQYGNRMDLYLEAILSQFARFAQENNQYFFVIAHPTKEALTRNASGNYDRPHSGVVAGGAMWNNMMDNILVYHRPLRKTDPDSTQCELTTEKVRRQKTVGKIGTRVFEYDFKRRRFIFNGVDPLQELINTKGQVPKQASILTAGYQTENTRPPAEFWNEP